MIAVAWWHALALAAVWVAVIAVIVLWFHQATSTDTPTPRDDWALWSGELGDAPERSIHPGSGEEL